MITPSSGTADNSTSPHPPPRLGASIPASKFREGAGKTVAARAATARLDASRHQLIAIPNPQAGARGIHHAVVAALGGVPRVHHATLIPQAAEHLAAELAERGRLPVLLIDEAHLLSHDQLEAIRMLTSAQLDSASPLAVLLLGQPQLRASMRLGVLPPWTSGSASDTRWRR